MELLRLNIQLFAGGSNSTTLSSGAGNKATLSVSFNETNASDPDIANNKTTISASATMKMTSGSFSVSSTWYVRLYWHDNKNNKDVEVANVPVSALSRNQSVTASASFDVEHNSDGTLSGYAIAKWDATGGNYTPYAGQVDTDWIALTTIPRTSKIGNHSGNVGYNLLISWSRASSSFTHTLKITFGGKTYTYSGLATSYNWNVPAELYSVMSGKSGNGTLTLTTYSGSNAIGSASATLSLGAVENDVNPLLKNQPKNIIDTNDSTLALTNSSNVIIAHKSLAQLQLTFTTRGYAKAKKLIVNNVERTISAGVVDQNNSSITKYDVVIDLNTITSNRINISVTDTRDYSVPDVYEITEDNFINYIPLDISPAFKRVAPTTGEVGLSFSGNYFNNTFGKVDNSLTISYKYKEKYEEQYSELITLVKDVDYKIVDNTYYSGSGKYKSVLVLNETFDYKKLYELQLFVNDSVTTLPTIVATITKGVPIFWWNGEKVVVNGELYIADTNGENLQPVGGGDALPINAIFEYDGDKVPEGYEEVIDVIESGSNDKGTYIKYADGTMIQRGSVYTYVNINVVDGVLYRPAGEIGLHFPQNFIDNTYQVNFTASRDIIGGYVISKYVDVAWVWCFAPSSRGATGRYLDFIAIGKWK